MDDRVAASGERAVSPVIGTILIVAIVVILSSMAAFFIFGLTDSQAEAPQVKFEFDYDSDTDTVTIEMKGGDRIDSSNTGRLVVLVETDSSEERVTWASKGGGVVDLENDEISSGDSIKIDDASGADTGDRTLGLELSEGDSIIVLWFAPDTDSSATLTSVSAQSLAGGSSATGVLDDDGAVVTNPGGAIGGDGGAEQDVGLGSAQVLGSTADLDGDGLVEMPFIDGSGNLILNDSDDGRQTLVEKSAVASDVEPDTDKSLMAAGAWRGSPTSVFYSDADHEEIYRVETGGSPTLVEDVSANGVNSVLGIGDIDGDSDDELVYADDSQEIRYLESDGTTKTTGFTSGSSVGIGNGQLWDWDSDGTDEAVVVDGSNDIRLIDAAGAEASPAQSSVSAAKSPVTIADVDDDGTNELVYVDDSSTNLKYIDDVGGSPTVELFEDEDGNTVAGDKDTGVVS